MAWYNKYRPQTFEDVIGQELVKTVLQNALKKNKIKHAYLFNGSKGVGKTTLARIFANHLNDLENVPEAKIDILEMDAASHTGIDDIRQLKDSAQTPPVSGKYKIYIIDEVHMLSKAAMNALLKILEEPPEYLVFLLATTNPEKLLPTVLSRLTRLNLSNHSVADVTKRLRYIADQEGLKIDAESLELLAKRAFGSQRDAINLLETVASYELDDYDETTTAKLLGLLPDEVLEKASQWLLSVENNERDVPRVQASLLLELETFSFDGESFLAQLLEYLLDQSFEGQSQFDGIIPVVADVLSQKLPISEIVSVLALIQAKLRNGRAVQEVIPSSKKKELNELGEQENDSISNFSDDLGSQSTKKEPKTAIDKKVSEDGIKNLETKKLSEKEEEPLHSFDNFDDQKEGGDILQDSTLGSEFEPVKADNFENDNTEKDLSQIEDFVLSLQKDSECSPAFKMIMDLGADFDKATNKLTLSVTSGLFQSTLNSPKLKTWISDKVKKSFDVEIEIDSVIKTGIRRNVVSNSESGSANVSEKKAEYSKKTEVNVDTVENSGEEIFYKVYKKLPENMEDKGVPVRSEKIPEPIAKEADEKKEDNWDDVVDDFFEFE